MAETPPSSSTTLRPDPWVPREPRRPRGRPGMVGILLILVALLAVVGGVILVAGLPSGPAGPRGFPIPGTGVEPGSAVPHKAPVAPDGAEGGGRSQPSAGQVRDWVDRLSAETEIPARALTAYANAELMMRREQPDCQLRWSTLAGVGRVESHHGFINGSRVSDTGKVDPPIIGVPLDGGPGVRAVADTDGGRLDTDTEWDRAIGPMQFLPATWQEFAVRASADGQAPDPQHIDDAVFTAAWFLCGRGGDLSTPDGWWRSVLAYNGSTSYGRDVFDGADAYARAAARLR